MRTTTAYLDHAATSPMPEPVLVAYTEALRTVGNPASTHGHGQLASERLETARERIASGLGCDSAEVLLTSGGTESINLALKGMFWARRRAGSGPVLLVAEGEHHATIEAAEWLRDSQGAELVWLPIDEFGVVRPETLDAEIARIGAERIALVSFLWANNEVGSVQPVSELCRIARTAGVPAHVDAVAALGQISVDFRASGAAAMSVSAHKIGGPVGVGALVLGRHFTADPLFHGGTQQRARSGTQDVAGAIGFAAALDLVLAHGSGFAAAGSSGEDGVGSSADPDPSVVASIAALRDRLIAGVQAAIPEAALRGADPEAMSGTGSPARLPGNAHFTFPGCRGDALLFLLDAAGVSVSTGSACQAGVAEISHVLLAMGLDEATAVGALRFTLGADSGEDDVAALLAALPSAVATARSAGIG